MYNTRNFHRLAGCVGPLHTRPFPRLAGSVWRGQSSRLQLLAGWVGGWGAAGAPAGHSHWAAAGSCRRSCGSAAHPVPSSRHTTTLRGSGGGDDASSDGSAV